MKCLTALPLICLAGMLACPASARGATVESEADLPDKGPRPTLVIESRVGEGKWRKARAISPLSDQEVRLRVAAREGASVRWYLVFPDLSKTYANANPPWAEDPYQWVGVQKIDYYRVELEHLRDQWEVAPFAGKQGPWDAVREWLAEEKSAKSASMYYRDDAGTFRFQVIVEEGGTVLRSTGLEEVQDKGISNKVFRVSRRQGEGYLGYLTSFYNVPGVFGSILYQSENFIGVDCADVLVAAYGKFRRRRSKTNFNVDMLVGKHKRVAQAQITDGEPSEPLRWGKDFRAGDLIAVKYEGSNRFQHVGALARDADGDGVLSARDTVLHAGPYPLHESVLRRGAFDGQVVLLRLP